MKISNRARQALALALLCGSGLISGQVQASYGVDETAIEWVNRATKVAPATVDTAFGENLSLYDGTVEFNAVDLSLPGIGPAVEVRRSFPVRDTNTIDGLPEGNGERKELGDWSLDLPSLSGVFETGTGWQVYGDEPLARCSAQANPKPLSMFPTEVYWSGNELHVPGQVSELLLVNYATARPSPTDGKAYPWSTKSGWMISCTPTTANGYPGEGFMATSPDGTRYYLDWVVKRPYPGLTGPQYYSAFSGGYNISKIGRNKIYFLASKVVDRFGNQVYYNYTGDLLTSIASSDGRSISLTYANKLLTSVSGGTQTFSYAYTTGGFLQTVTRPDASKWTFTRTGQLSIEHETGMELQNQTKCTVQASTGEDFIYDVTNPAGLKGSFKFQTVGHVKRNVPEYCKSWQYGRVGEITTVKYWQIPLRSVAYSLVQKDVSGIGVPAATWTYNYNPVFMGLGMVGFRDDCVADPTVCPLSKTVLVNGPSRFERYTFGIWWGVNDGQLLKKEIGTDASNILYSEDYSYVTKDEAALLPFGDQMGSLVHQYLDRLPSQNRPLKTLIRTQQGATFKTDNLTYDVFARPTSVNMVSSLYPGKTEIRSYLDFLDQWVVGQPRKVIVCAMASGCTPTSTPGGTLVSQIDYDTDAFPIRRYEFGKLKQSFTYYADGTVNTVADGAGHVTTFANWKRGLPQTVTYPATEDQPTPVSESAVVDNNGWVASVTDSNGYKTCYSYDPMGRVNKITYPSESQVGVCDTSTWAPTTITLNQGNPTAYGVPAGHWRQTTLTGNSRHILVLDALWRPVVDQTLDLGNVPGTTTEIINRYDIDGHLVFQSYPMNTAGQAVYTDATLKGTHTTYDVLDRVTGVEQDSELDAALGHRLTTTTEYLNGFQTRVTDPNEKQTLTTLYQAYDQPTYEFPRGINHPEGAYTEIDRDIFGKPTALVRRNATSSISETRRYSYNTNQELCRTDEPETGSTFMGYDAAGNPSWSAAGIITTSAGCLSASTVAARRVDRTYDARNRLLSMVFPDHRGDTTYHYTPDGQVSYMIADNGGTDQVRTNYAYNHRRLLSSESLVWSTINWPISYGYDANGHLSSQNWHGLLVDYAPNALGQPTKAGTFASGVSFYPNGALKQFTYGNGIVHTMTQNVRQLPERSRDAYGAVAVLDDSYDYDPNANVAAISDALPGNRGNRTMSYDGLNRLTGVVSPMFGTTGAHYTYDVLDNLTHVGIGGTSARDQYYCYDTAKWQLTNIKTGSCAGATVTGLGYDAQGNVVNKNGALYDFDFGNRLRDVTSGGTVVASYVYDGKGLRVRDDTTASKYSQYNQAGQLTMTGDARTNKVDEYIWLAGSLVAIRERDVPTNVYTVKYQHTDALGSPVAITDPNRVVTERNEYEPYGKGPSKDMPGYTGHVADAATGLDYMQQRYYDPYIGRFLSADPISADIASFNRYWYGNDDPFGFKDPDGRQVESPWRDQSIRNGERRSGCALANACFAADDSAIPEAPKQGAIPPSPVQVSFSQQLKKSAEKAWDEVNDKVFPAIPEDAFAVGVAKAGALFVVKYDHFAGRLLKKGFSNQEISNIGNQAIKFVQNIMRRIEVPRGSDVRGVMRGANDVEYGVRAAHRPDGTVIVQSVHEIE